MSDEWRNDPATKKQKEKLCFFGCEWKGKITKGEASDAISECVRQFPDKENEWQERPATAEQKKFLNEVGEDVPPELTYSQAKEMTEQWDDVQTEEQEAKEDLELRVDIGLGGLYTWEYEPKVSRKRIREAIQHLDQTKPGWTSTGDLIDALEELKATSSGSASKPGQGCLVILVAFFVISAAGCLVYGIGASRADNGSTQRTSQTVSTNSIQR